MMPGQRIMILLGDFNAHIRNDIGVWNVGVRIGQYAHANLNDNRKLLLQQRTWHR